MNNAEKIDLDLERKARAEIDRKAGVIRGLVYAGKTVFLRDAASGMQLAFFNLSNVGKVRSTLRDNSNRACRLFVQRTGEAGDDECIEFNMPPAPTEEAPAEEPAPAAPAAVEAPQGTAPQVEEKPEADAEAPKGGEAVAGDAGDADDDDADDGPQDAPTAPSEPSATLVEARRRTANERRAVLTEFNRRFQVVNDGGAALIFSDEHDAVLKRKVYRRMTTGALKVLYLNRHVCTRITDDGQRSYKCAADFWLQHAERRQYVGGVTFDPSKSTNDPDVLNLWRGFAFEPKRGSWGRLMSHIKNILCQGNEKHFDYFMGWMARLVQCPADPGEVAIVLRGNVGTGKGTVGHALLALFRQHGMHISSPKHLIGNFNAHLRDCVLLFADEAFFAGDKASLGVLKAIITEKVLTIEAKHINAIQCPNMLHIIMASNSDWVVPAALDERRFFVLDVADDHKQDKPYFAAIQKELDAGGYAAMLYDLLRFDLSGFEVRDVPETKALQDQKKQSLGSKHSWWREVLARGYVYRSKLGLEGYFGDWHEFVATDLLFDSYRDFAKENGERHLMSREMLGKFLHELGCNSAKPSEAIVGEHLVPGGAALIRKRKPGFQLGSLDEARDAFERVTGLLIGWES